MFRKGEIESFIFWGDILAQLFGRIVEMEPPGRRKPSIGQRILPHQYKRNKKAIVLANISVWIMMVVGITLIVKWLS